MNITLLDYGDASHKTDYIQHITKLVSLEILPNETFKEHFDRLVVKCLASEEEAINDFIKLQDKAVLSLNIWEAYNLDNPEDINKVYLNFNIWED